MGRLEKIVVVVVLFLVAVILGISLGTDGEGSSPIVGRNGNRAPKTEEAPDVARVPANDTAGGLMNSAGTVAQPAGTQPAGTQPEPQPTVPPSSSPSPAGAAPQPPAGLVAPNGTTAQPEAAPASTGPGAADGSASLLRTPTVKIESQFLVSREGLEPTATDDLMLYTWKSGDTFKALSQKFYGSNLHVARLRNANEGRKEELLAAGEKILVPVAPAAAADRIARSAPKEASSTTAWTGGLYTVSSGDVLGAISQKVYGTSKKWKKIYDANRDVIGENPNALKVGTRLRIPE